MRITEKKSPNDKQISIIIEVKAQGCSTLIFCSYFSLGERAACPFRVNSAAFTLPFQAFSFAKRARLPVPPEKKVSVEQPWVKAVPGASCNKIMGEYNEALKIAVQAPPEKGKANEMLLKFLAKTLGISKQNIKIISGETNQIKKIQILGIEKECFLQLISK